MSRSDRFATLLALLCALGFVHAIYDPREATTKPPYRREPVLPWYLSSQDDQNSTDDQSRSPKWEVDPDNPIPKKPYIVNAETETWTPWRKTSANGIEHRTEIATDPPSLTNFNQDRDYLYNSRDLEQRQDGNPARHKGNSENARSNSDFYEGISPDNTKPRKEELSLSSKLKSTVARYDSRLGVQCPEVDSTGQFIYPPDCKFFVNCWKGRAFVQPCAPGTLFSPDTLECDFPHKVSCYGGEVADFPSSEPVDSFRREPLLSNSHTFLEHERLQEPRCPPHVTGLLPHPSDCKKFLQCANGGTFIMDCGPGTVFNPAVSVCDWPHAVRGCEDSFKSKDDTTVPLVPPEYGSNNGHEKLKYNEHQPVKKIACPPDYTGLLPHPDTCKKFLQCTNGGTFIMDCGPGTAFNPQTSVCDWPYNVPSCSDEKATTARPWSPIGPSDSRKWEHGRQYNWTPKVTTSRPGTDWEVLRPTWRPYWMSNAWSTAKPSETVPSNPPGQYSHGGHYNRNVPSPNLDAPPRWDYAENSGSPSGQWQHSGNHDETYHQHQHHNHRHYPHTSVYPSNRRTESQQPAPPYDSSQPEGSNKPTFGSNWHSNSGHHRQNYDPISRAEPSYFTPSESWHPSSGHHDHPHGRPHSASHYPEYDDSDQQTQQRPFDGTDDSSNTRVSTPPDESSHSIPSGSWHSNSEYHNHHYGRPHSGPHHPKYDDADQQTQQRPFDQTEDGSISHVRFDEGNFSTNRGIEYVYTPNRKEYSRSGSGLSPLPGENIYVDSAHELPEDSRSNDNRQTTQNSSSRSHQGPSSQPQNRQWDQGTASEDSFRESGPRINIYQSTADKEADSKLNQWSSNTNIFHRVNGKYPPGVKDASFDPSKTAPPSNAHMNVNGTRYHFVTKGIQVHQGHSNTKTYGPNDPRNSNQFDRNDQNIYIDSQSPIPLPSMGLQPPYYNPVNRSTGVENVSWFDHGRRTPKYHRISSPSQNSDDLAGSDTRYHRVIVSETNVEQPNYPPPSRSFIPSTNGATNLEEDGNYYIPSNLQPPYYDESSGTSNYSAKPAIDLQPPFLEPQQPDRFLVPPSPDTPNSSSQRPNSPMGNSETLHHQGNDRSGNASDVVKTASTSRRVPDMHLVVPVKKKVQRTLEKTPMTVITTTESNVPSVEIEEDDNVSTTDNSDAVEPNVDYDIDVLDEKKVWKPVLVFQNRTPVPTESTNIMKINQKKADIDLFNIEEPPFEEEEPPFPSYYVPPVEPLDHSRKVAHPTPISGQVIRLRGGSGPHDGYVEVQGKIPGWGIVCDSSWTLKEADIVCKQLGYTRGAEMAWKGRDNRNGVPKWVAANSVSCQGNETRFQLCKFIHEPECRVERDAVGVKCVLNRIAHCRKGEIPYEGHCYHLADPDRGFNHAEALDYCSKRQSRLIDITSQAENDFVSEWLLQKHPEVGSVMTSAVGFTTMGHTLWVWEDSSHAKFKYSKWWPGWMEDKKDPPTVGSQPLCIVMKRKFPCHERPDSLCVADYFFWDSEDCATSTKGHSYICKRPYDDIGCVYGKGGQYAGNANVTTTGRPCLPWSDEKVAHSLSILTLNRDVKEKLKTHNYCRNPQPLKDSSPWCFTGRGQREYCDIPPCGNIVTQRSRLSGQCKPRHFECLPGECIPSPWVCDGEEDCTNGADERACTSQMDLFKKHAKHKLEGHDVEKWLNTPLKTCALRCKEADFTCRSFSHKAAGNICLLSDSNIGMTGSLKPNREFDYYEMRDRSINCDGMFVCGNRKCINQNQVCNGKNDCNDRSDESICTVENLDYAIRLAGSDHAYEGRVEVKILGVWGQVCDDGFGMNDANVICKELGFDLGALEVRPGGFYGNLDPPTRFMVDQLQCRGNETSLRECDFEGWGVHNCQPEEAVGIVCKTAVDACQDDYWKCDNSPTCILNAYICDEVMDCPDGSDESAEHCDAPFEIRLANGSTALEGRVEVRHHGIWGTVCDDDFSNAAATVICRSLGYGGQAMVKKNGFFGPGEGPIWLDEVSCRGNETQLYRCDHNNWGRHNCDHEEDAGVICTHEDAQDSKSNWSPLLEKNIEDILPANCGRRFKDFNEDEDLIFGKVVHGNIAPEGSYPWQASLRVRGHSRSSHWCGAVVVSPLHVITAAHCLEGYNKGTYFVRAGDYNTERDEGTEAEANIEDYYIHEDFRKGHRMNNDIALVLLKGRGIPLGKDVMPICLPPESIEYPSGLNCTISGFGSIKTGVSTHSNDLRYGWVPLLDQSVCRAGHVYGEAAISDGMFCAGFLDEGVDTCDGDSGGPLACYHNGAFTLYGITSWGQHCGKVNKPGVYVRVSYYRRWIDQKIKESLSGR